MIENVVVMIEKGLVIVGIRHVVLSFRWFYEKLGPRLDSKSLIGFFWVKCHIEYVYFYIFRYNLVHNYLEENILQPLA